MRCRAGLRLRAPHLGRRRGLHPSERVRVGGTIENRLLPGRYFVNIWIARNRTQGDIALHQLRLLDFVVYGTRPGPGNVEIAADVSAVVEPEPPA